MRRTVTLLMIFVGFLFQIVAYLFLTSLIAPTTGPEVSDPRLQYSPALFIVGVMLVFLSAVVYELMSDRPDDHDH